ncbi:hypothetical protein ACF0H5_005045 [Mactra antiquata]
MPFSRKLNFTLLLIHGVMLNAVIAVDFDVEELFTNCGQVTEKPRGFLTTPSFPGPFPTPIYCEWLIKAPTDETKNFKIVLYFTQNYMKDSIFLTSYDYFQDVSTYVGRVFHGQVGWEDADMFVSHKRFLLVQFAVETIGNSHIRVIDHLLDVYGFNITYEILDSNTDVREKTCSVKNCSYLGVCEVSDDFNNFTCRCFDKFFGNSCQYGPFCDPTNGINMCLNGGECRYFCGSLINQCHCPEGYGGTSCEIVLADDQNSSNLISKECEELQCSYACSTDTGGNVYCLCPEGYELDKDNINCKQIEWYRFDVKMSLSDQINIKYEAEVEQISTLIKESFVNNGVTTMERFNLQDFSKMVKYSDIRFSFYCHLTEHTMIPNVLNELSKHTINGSTISSIFYEDNPGLLLTEVNSIEPQATLRGKMMSIVCSAKGSKNMQFSWYKDGARVNTRLTLRNVWESVYPHSVHGMYLYALNIDSAMPIDQGIFTCVVEDFGEIQSKSVVISVNNYPMVELDPMSLSVNKGSRVSFKCLSLDDSWQGFKYEWLRDGIAITADSKTEYAEEMLPTGVQLVVEGIKQHTQYTCRVTNEAGSANVTAHVYVIADNTSTEFCPINNESHVMWSRTAGGHFDVKLCPTEQGGHARRKCECDSHGHNCHWAKPNLSKCQSLKLVHIHDQLDALRSGYIQTEINAIFDAIYSFTLSNSENSMLFSGDIDMVAGILHGLMSHLNNFPLLVDNDRKIDAQRLLKLMSVILIQSERASDEEKKMIDVGASIISTIHTVVTGAINYLVFDKPVNIATDILLLQETELMEVPCVACTNHPIVKNKSKDYKLYVTVYTMRTNYLSDLLEHRYKHDNGDYYKSSYRQVSTVVSIGHKEYDMNSFGPPTVRFTIQHSTTIGGTEKTQCLKWVYEARDLYSGHWKIDGCVAVEFNSHSTTCECRLPGHFIVVAEPSGHTEKNEEMPETKTNLILITGLSISLLPIVLAVIIYVRLFRELQQNFHQVHLTFIVSILCFIIACIVNIAQSSTNQFNTEMLCWILTFTYYVASFDLVLEMTLIYICIMEVKTVTITRTRILCICLGISFLLTIPLTLISIYVESGDTSIWLHFGTQKCIVFLLIVGVLTIIYLVSLVSCIFSLRKWTGEIQHANKIKYMKSIGKNCTIYFLYLLVMLLNIDLSSSSDTLQVIMLIIFHNILCMVVFVVRILLDNDVRHLLLRLCSSHQRSDLDPTTNNKSFCAYMKPGMINNTSNNSEADNVSKYYDEVNRTKYTMERKRQLSFLLGSGSTGDGTASSDSTTRTSLGYSHKRPSSAPSFTVNALIHSGTDGGMLIKDNSKSSTSSVGASGSVKDEIKAVGIDNLNDEVNEKSRLHRDSSRGNPKTIQPSTIDDHQTQTLNQPLHLDLQTNLYKTNDDELENEHICNRHVSNDSRSKNKSKLNDSSYSPNAFNQIDKRLLQKSIFGRFTICDYDSDDSVDDSMDTVEAKALFITTDSENEDDCSSNGSKILSSSEGGC